MKKNNFKKLALLGLTSGFLVSSSSSLNAEGNNENNENKLLASLYHSGGCSHTHKCSGKVAERETKPTPTPAPSDPNSQNLGYHLMSENELLIELNDEGKALYESLDANGKQLARQVASQRCQASNACKGLGACLTDKHSCAGKNDCKAQSKCALADKNLAVKLVANKMKAKRNEAAN